MTKVAWLPVGRCRSFFMVVFLALISSYATLRAQSLMPTQHFPKPGRLVAALKGGVSVSSQWKGTAQVGYGITEKFAVEIRSYILYPHENRATFSTSVVIRLKPFFVSNHVSINCFLGGRYGDREAGFDVGFVVESITGKIGLVAGTSASVQVLQTQNIFPLHINLGMNYRFIKSFGILFQIDIGVLDGAPTMFSIGTMFTI